MSQIAIIGAGASGMAAALEAARDPKNSVLLFECQSRVGRKLLATGNGRCNLSNLVPQQSKYHGDNTGFVLPALKRFDVESTLNFFKALGLLTWVEDGDRIYPRSNHAASVVDVLRFGLEQAGVKLHCGSQVTDIKRKNGTFSVTANQKSFTADTVIVACGGAAGAHLGASPDGYRLLEAFGHKRTKLFPSLVQIKTDPLYPRALKGVKVCAGVSVVSGGRVDAQARGELLFTEYGVSGPAVFDVSRAAATGCRGQELHIDLLPDCDTNELFTHLDSRRRLAPDLGAERILTGSLQNRLALILFKAAGMGSGKKLADITENELWVLAKLTKCLKLEILGTMGFENAQVTAGGIKTSEFDPFTMQSRLVPNLFACGEVLDIDGDCGGYNLQWAWSSGRLAGRAGKKYADVVAALIKQGNKFLICQRPEDKQRGLLWEFVGGKVEPGESKKQALIRECREELGIALEVEDIYMSVEHRYPDLDVRLTVFRAFVQSGEVKMLEHNDIRWIGVEEIANYSFCPADAEILKRINRDAAAGIW